jgi:hypothetical protein
LCYKQFSSAFALEIYVVKLDAQQARWVDLYHTALLETDYQRLPERLKLVDDAIQARLQILSASGGTEELSSIQDAKYMTAGGLEGEFSLLSKDGRRIPIRYQGKVYPDGCRVARWKPPNQETQSEHRDFREKQAS